MEREFIFYNRANDLYPTILEVVSFIQSVIEPTTKRITSRCSVILTELLTNAIKHCAEPTSTINVEIQNNKLRIAKADRGARFLEQQLTTEETVGRKILLAADPLSELYVVEEGEFKFRFIIEDRPISSELQIQELVEHYGLQMITRASDDFYYEHHPEDNLNMFTAIITL